MTRTWRCGNCGSLRAVEERPTRCYHCRQGEHEHGERRLFEPFDPVPATDGGVIDDGDETLRCPHCGYSWSQRDDLDERTRCASCGESIPAAVCRLNQIGADDEWTVEVPLEVTETVDVVEQHTKEGVTRLEVLLAAATFVERDAVNGGETE
jgi:DNA-directed RNA polymerase subunit RPC12/RpoP